MTWKASQDIADPDEKILWVRYEGRLDEGARTVLIERYSSLAKIIAATLYSRRHSDEIEFEEYYQFGMVGLVESVDRYESGRGASFETFATYRIRGSILNGIEKLTERQEQLAYRSRVRKERLASIAENGQECHDNIFEEMVEIALGLAISYMLDDTSLIQSSHKTVDQNVYQAHEMAHLREMMVKSIDTLPNRERLIIEYHYFKQINFSSISEILNVSKGRVSQLHKRALQLVRRQLMESQSLDGYY